MKLLIYTEYFLPISGGVQTNVYELACGLSEYRENESHKPPFEVTIVTRTKDSTPNDNSWPFLLVRYPSATRLFALIRQADVIHVAGPALLPMLFALVLRKPVVVAHHGYQSICPNGLLLLGTNRRVCPGHFMAARYWKCVRCNAKDLGLLGGLRNLLLMFPRRLLSKMVAANVAVTDHVARRLLLPRTRTVFHGITDPGGARLPQNDGKLQIGYVGRLVQEKGLPVLLSAAKRLQDDGFSFHLTVVGDGPLRAQLEVDSQKCGLANYVTFTGNLSGTVFERAVRPIQIVVVPSVCEETAGLTAIEQMMRGGVVLVSDIGGLSEIVGEAGLKFSAGSVDDLYLKLREVAETPSLICSLSTQARARAIELFSRERMIEAHALIYNNVFRSRQAPAA